MSEKKLIAEILGATLEEIKKTLATIAEKNPSWRLFLGTESLSASDLIKRLGKDKKLTAAVLKHYHGLIAEFEQKAREKIEGSSSST